MSEGKVRNGMRRITRGVLSVNGGGAQKIMAISGKEVIKHALARHFLILL